MGIFAWIDGRLHAPDFAGHGGTATGSLGTFTPWQQVGISQQPVGDGSPGSPFTVTVSLAAPGTDVRLNMSVTYVRGNNFFRIRTNFFSTTNTVHDIDAYLGADIFLASSDNGIFVTVPQLAAVGGRNCDPAQGSYNILLIPITAADGFTTANFSEVWRQIGTHALDNNTEGQGCIDNGAAVQWSNIMSGGSTSVELLSAVSFGDIPSPSNFHGFVLDVDPDFVTLSPGESVQLTINSRHNAELEFNSPITFSAPNLPQGVSLVFDNNGIPAPGTGTVTATLSIDNTVFPQLYQNLGIFGTGGNETRGTFFSLDVACVPPKILGINQPQSVTVPRGQRATLRVTPEAGGLFSYEWFNGHAPLTFNRIPNSNSAELQTQPINEVQQFWVRITNPCGSVNSLTATVIPTN
jgi:hypothetical protein